MKIKIQDGLPYVTISLTYRGQEITLQRVLFRAYLKRAYSLVTLFIRKTQWIQYS